MFKKWKFYLTDQILFTTNINYSQLLRGIVYRLEVYEQFLVIDALTIPLIGMKQPAVKQNSKIPKLWFSQEIITNISDYSSFLMCNLQHSALKKSPERGFNRNITPLYAKVARLTVVPVINVGTKFHRNARYNDARSTILHRYIPPLIIMYLNKRYL